MTQTRLFVHEIIAELLHICRFSRPYYAPIHAYINQQKLSSIGSRRTHATNSLSDETHVYMVIVC